VKTKFRIRVMGTKVNSTFEGTTNIKAKDANFSAHQLAPVIIEGVLRDAFPAGMKTTSIEVEVEVQS